MINVACSVLGAIFPFFQDRTVQAVEAHDVKGMQRIAVFRVLARDPNNLKVWCNHRLGMSETCTCDDTIIRDATKEELGPAYSAYKDGKSISQKYK